MPRRRPRRGCRDRAARAGVAVSTPDRFPLLPRPPRLSRPRTPYVSLRWYIDDATAFHEAGHTLCAWGLGCEAAMTAATCDSAHSEGAVAWLTPGRGWHDLTPWGRAIVTAGGIAAEDVFCGDPHTDGHTDTPSTDLSVLAMLTGLSIANPSLGDRARFPIDAFATARRFIDKHREAVFEMAKLFHDRDLSEGDVAWVCLKHRVPHANLGGASPVSWPPTPAAAGSG